MAPRPDSDGELPVSQGSVGVNLAPRGAYSRGESTRSLNDSRSSVGEQMHNSGDLKFREIMVTRHSFTESSTTTGLNGSLPAMKVADEFNLLDLAREAEDEGAGGTGGDGNDTSGDKNKWWWQRGEEHNDDNARVQNGYHDNYGQKGAHTDSANRRGSLDHGPAIARRSSIGAIFGIGQPKQPEPEVPTESAEEYWGNTTWATNSMGRLSTDNAPARVMPPQPATRRRASISFGIVNSTFNSAESEQPSSICESSAPATTAQALFMGIKAFGGSGESKESALTLASADPEEEKARIQQDQNLTNMLHMLREQRSGGKKTCTNVANAVIVKEYMEVQRRASMNSPQRQSDSASSVHNGSVANKETDAKVNAGGARRSSIGFGGLGDLWNGLRNETSQLQREEGDFLSRDDDSFGQETMTELKDIGSSTSTMRPKLEEKASSFRLPQELKSQRGSLPVPKEDDATMQPWRAMSRRSSMNL